MAKLLLLLMTAAAPAQAQRTGKWDLSLLPGYATALGDVHFSKNILAGADGGDFKLPMGNAFAFSFQMLHEFSEWVSGGVEAGFSFGHQFKGELDKVVNGDLDDLVDDGLSNQSAGGDSMLDGSTFSSNVYQNLIWFSPIVRIGTWFETDGAMLYRPHLMLGVGYYHQDNADGAGIRSGVTSRGFNLETLAVTHSARKFVIPGRSSNDGGISLGAGISMLLGQRLELGCDARWHLILGSGGDFIMPAARLAYLF